MMKLKLFLFLSTKAHNDAYTVKDGIDVPEIVFEHIGVTCLSVGYTSQQNLRLALLQ